YAADPMDAAAPAQMIIVCMGRGDARLAMEEWFVRSMEAIPGYLTACRAKLGYLEPKWHGSTTELLSFGRECVESRNFVHLTPMCIVEAHELVARDVQ